MFLCWIFVAYFRDEQIFTCREIYFIFVFFNFLGKVNEGEGFAPWL